MKTTDLCAEGLRFARRPITRASFDEIIVDACNAVARRLGMPPLTAAEADSLYERHLAECPDHLLPAGRE